MSGNFAISSFSRAISATQLAHHVAQNSITRGLPFRASEVVPALAGIVRSKLSSGFTFPIRPQESPIEP